MPALIFCLLISGTACKQQRTTDRAFYYWKSRYTATALEKQVIGELGVSKIYVKLFDVVWDETQQTARPVAKVSFDSASLQWTNNRKIEIVPKQFARWLDFTS